MPRFGQPGAPRRGRGRQKLPPPPYVAPPNDGAPPLLQDYRHVWSNDAVHDKTYGQWVVRQFLTADIGNFSAGLARMEKDFRKQCEKEYGKGGQPMKRDLGTERCIELIERLLSDLEAKEAKQ